MYGVNVKQQPDEHRTGVADWQDLQRRVNRPSGTNINSGTTNLAERTARTVSSSDLDVPCASRKSESF